MFIANAFWQWKPLRQTMEKVGEDAWADTEIWIAID